MKEIDFQKYQIEYNNLKGKHPEILRKSNYNQMLLDKKRIVYYHLSNDPFVKKINTKFPASISKNNPLRSNLLDFIINAPDDYNKINSNDFNKIININKLNKELHKVIYKNLKIIEEKKSILSSLLDFKDESVGIQYKEIETNLDCVVKESYNSFRHHPLIWEEKYIAKRKEFLKKYKIFFLNKNILESTPWLKDDVELKPSDKIMLPILTIIASYNFLLKKYDLKNNFEKKREINSEINKISSLKQNFLNEILKTKNFWDKKEKSKFIYEFFDNDKELVQKYTKKLKLIKMEIPNKDYKK